jgi:hypothetical protein
MSNTETPSKISPEDLQQKLQSFQDGVQSSVDDKKNTLAVIGGGVAVVVLLIVFMLGKRSGKKKTTLVEIKRI